MNAMPNMIDVLRLTRGGRLDEATARLRSGLAAGNEPARRTSQKEATGEAAPHSSPLIDFEGPAAPGGAWRGPVEMPRVDTPQTKPAEWFKIKLWQPQTSDLPGLRMKSRASVPVPEGASFSMHQVHVGGVGALSYKLYVPSKQATTMPLVVMLHGCTQNPDDFAAGTQMNALAEAHGFLVAYPEQTQAANASRCWNWFRPGDQVRDRGEPALVAEATRQILDTHPVDPTRVFVAGLSAGGAAAAIMGCGYPDLFAGVGVHSGLACGAASDIPSAFAAMRGGGTKDGPTSRVPTIVFHGTADRTVAPGNASAVAAKVPGEVRVETTARGTSRDGTLFTRTIRRDAAGKIVGETWMIDGAGHAWSGGSSSGSYTSPSGPDASREMLRFFGIIQDR